MECIVVRMLWSVKFDVPVFRRACQTSFQRFRFYVLQFVGKQRFDEIGLYLPGISVFKAESCGYVPYEMLKRDSLQFVLVVMNRFQLDRLGFMVRIVTPCPLYLHNQ